MTSGKKNTILCFLLFFFPSILSAQLNVDSAYVFSLIDKAEEFFTSSQYDSALYYTEKAASFSRAKNFKRGLAYSLIEKTDIFIDKDDLEKAALYPPQAEQLGLQLKDSLIVAVSWMQMAQIKMYKGDFHEAAALFGRSLQHYLAAHPTKYSALAFNDLGYTWGRIGELSKQANCLIQSINIYENYFPDHYGELGIAYNNLSTVYYNLNDRAKAIEYARKSLVYREKSGDIARLSLGCCNLSQFYTGIDNKEAEKYLRLCVDYALQSNQESRIIHSYVTAANLYNTNNKPSEALEYELKAISALEKSGKDPSMLARRYMAAATLCRRLGKDSAEIMKYFSKSQWLLTSIQDKANLRDLYLQLSNYHAENKNFSEAYAYYRKYIVYRDSIVGENTKSAIAEINARYESEKKDNEILKLTSEQSIKQLQIEKQKALIAASRLEARRKQNEIELLSQSQELQQLRIKQQDEQLERQLLQAKTNEQQLQLAEKEKQLQERKLKSSQASRNFILAGAALIALLSYFLFNRYQLKRKIKEQQNLLAVRNNIARDLHDEIGSTLTSIKILSEVSEKSLQHDQLRTSSFLQKIAEQSASVQQGISDIVWAVKPENDKIENMVIRMREYIAHTLESKNIQTEISVDEQLLNKTLDMHQRRDFFLVFKEAVNNIVKYADATKVLVKLERNDNGIALFISDNGKGFDATRITSSNGLKNMKSRAADLGGHFTLQSEQGKGTSVSLIIPAT